MSLLTKATLAKCLNQPVSFVDDMVAAGFAMPGGCALEDWALEWLRNNPGFECSDQTKWQMAQLDAAKDSAAYDCMKMEDAAAWMSIPLRTFKKYVSEGKIGSYSIGKHRRFKKADLESAMKPTRAYAGYAAIR